MSGIRAYLSFRAEDIIIYLTVISSFSHISNFHSVTFSIFIQSHFQFLFSHIFSFHSVTFPIFIQTHFRFSFSHISDFHSDTFSVFIQSHFIINSKRPLPLNRQGAFYLYQGKRIILRCCKVLRAS